MSSKTFLFAILSLAVVIQLGYARVVKVEEIFETDEEKATWSDFQKRHVLEPVGSDAGYTGWTRTEWNNFLKTRISDYGTKSVNSFIVTTPAAILSDMASATKPHSDASNLFWSTRTFSIYVMQLSGSSYNAYKCGRLYFLAGLTSKQPVHYHGQSSSQPSSGSLPLNLHLCDQIS